MTSRVITQQMRIIDSKSVFSQKWCEFSVHDARGDERTDLSGFALQGLNQEEFVEQRHLTDCDEERKLTESFRQHAEKAGNQATIN